jgi:hypothetical protein
MNEENIPLKEMNDIILMLCSFQEQNSLKLMLILKEKLY